MPERNVQQKPKICDIIPKHNTMKYIISADLWLTARIGQQPHLLKKQQTPSACHMVTPHTDPHTHGVTGAEVLPLQRGVCKITCTCTCTCLAEPCQAKPCHAMPCLCSMPEHHCHHVAWQAHLHTYICGTPTRTNAPCLASPSTSAPHVADARWLCCLSLLCFWSTRKY